jgi:hypothetical protein
LFNRKCRGILDTPPLDIRPDGLRVVSMVCHADVKMYLLAVKSFLGKLGRGEPTVIDDGSLTPEDGDILRRHLPSVRIVPIRSVDTGRCPRGGTWERLVHIVDASADGHYVIQLDSDTLTMRDIPEVAEAVKANRSFLLGTAAGTRIAPIKEAVDLMRNSDSRHVQALAESGFERLRGYPGLAYCRGCSGFAGFAKGAFRRSDLEDFSAEMEAMLGDKWREWGSEQVGSNFVLANSPGAGVLPYPAYSEFNPRKNWAANQFLHFIGTYRWSEGIYASCSKEVIRGLSRRETTASA